MRGLNRRLERIARMARDRQADAWEENGVAAAIRRELFERAARRGGGEDGRQV